MRIEIDAVVHQYVMRMIAATFYAADAPLEMIKETERAQEVVFMHTLEGMIMSGAAEHNYDPLRKIDEFISTDRLIKHWGWLFPGSSCDVDRSERLLFEIKGKRDAVA
jgi:hypothetical protein